MHDAFVDLLVSKVQALQLGPGSDPGTTHGPLITAAAVDGVRSREQCGREGRLRRCIPKGYPRQMALAVLCLKACGDHAA